MSSEGTNITMELDDAFFGERRYEVTDHEGHRWHFGERFGHELLLRSLTNSFLRCATTV
jgi:hypothetical protein